ncbi:hypothetical protein [Marinobacterium aestuariivivens]|uniref:Uncharacterized protein n=1 Tax=Marinobacterium aestuariivivens TaxID=1698799 RepID=A0ABW1ZVK6_9GAMM
MNEWFTMVGFILSPSDFESFHMAIGEGMLTGAMPIVWKWKGAEEIWKGFTIESLADAKNLVLDSSNWPLINSADFIRPFCDVQKEWFNLISPEFRSEG